MKIGLVGGSSQQRSLPFNAERTVNLFAVMDKEGKEVSALYGTPGLSIFGSSGVGPGRGGFASSNGRVFEVSGFNLVEISSNGVATVRGSLDSGTGIVSMDENPFQLAICDGNKVYIFTYATNAFAKVTDPDLPAAGTITFIDGYFVVNKLSSGSFYISGINDGTTWQPLDFASAESSPDELLRVLNVLGQLGLFGTYTTELFNNTGNPTFPFERISGAKIDVGILAPHTAVAIDNSFVWVGRDRNGAGIVYRAQGFTPQRISTNAIEVRIQAAPSPSTLRAYTYQEEGHVFYCITGGGMETTLCLDLSTGLWHERAFLNSFGQFEPHLAAYVVYGFNRQLAFDRRNGNIYTQAVDIYSDNGSPIARDRIYTHLSDENQRVKFSNLTIGFETGVGTEAGLDPQAMLRVSNDGGKTWSGGQTKTIGKIGEYFRRVVFYRLGQARIRTFWLRITDPVKVAITGSYLQ